MLQLLLFMELHATHVVHGCSSGSNVYILTLTKFVMSMNNGTITLQLITAHQDLSNHVSCNRLARDQY